MSKRKADACTEGANKKPRIGQKFRENYSEQFPCVKRSSVSIYHALCTVCVYDFKVSHGGILDVQRHVKSARHTQISDCKKATPSVTNFFSGSQSDNLELIRAETLFANFLVEHNIALSASDHAGNLFRKMFPNSSTAQQFGCGRTKTTAIVKCLAHEAKLSAADHLKKGPFIIGTDASQEGGDKFFPMVVRYIRGGMIVTELLANPTCKDSATGENIFKLLSDTFASIDVPWANCLSLVCDNAYVMTGRHKGVISFVLKEVPEAHLAGCVCHLLSLASKKATKAFQSATGFDVDDILRQTAWYVNKSSNRQHRLKAIQEECGVPQLKVVDHCPTR
eukprot:TRINITY_DN1993_c0_g1_i4.p1 TRINITY_DN1993_c0_g1~~TRINITY_DN1993_c0_g1_i4.p1  ORF type:complete len:336 (+),score=40.99 TRINITY_DN1993_c0_g1_i4:441-1448(+)